MVPGFPPPKTIASDVVPLAEATKLCLGVFISVVSVQEAPFHDSTLASGLGTPEQAKAALEIADGEDVTPKDDIVENESDRAALNKERKRSRFNFAQVGIEPGEILEFKKDPSITAKVVENDQIEFRGNVTSLSPAALIIVQEMGYKWTKIAGPQFWMYKGKTLYELNQEK